MHRLCDRWFLGPAVKNRLDGFRRLSDGLQMSDEITWVVKDKITGAPRATVVMKAGDIASMPADIRHTGYSAKRTMLLVCESNSMTTSDLIRSGKAARHAGQGLTQPAVAAVPL
jgi:hypothetical protein